MILAFKRIAQQRMQFSHEFDGGEVIEEAMRKILDFAGRQFAVDEVQAFAVGFLHFAEQEVVVVAHDRQMAVVKPEKPEFARGVGQLRSCFASEQQRPGQPSGRLEHAGCGADSGKQSQKNQGQQNTHKSNLVTGDGGNPPAASTGPARRGRKITAGNRDFRDKLLKRYNAVAKFASFYFENPPGRLYYTAKYRDIGETIQEAIDMKTEPVLYLVVPCYNEEVILTDSAAKLSARLRELRQRFGLSSASRILFVDDGSTDATWAIIKGLIAQDPVYAGLKLAANRGHQNALLAGLMKAQLTADAVISLDADLQDDITVLDEFVAAYLAGSDIVYGVRSDRSSDSFFKRNSALAFYRRPPR
ncbi:Undecaprenyl-phosphate 4-deoxy-4-formamido-L-arabinose transferase [bioreactor metagenome]|uniref:Undecaprenyl-phosphate 4-deoxy-4-formamido-L-arabinose transferase n=1 Tax=bioreactor metagenome TaxID=1076179 RepID=A0A644ZSJ2_9ZZZZ